MKKAATFLLLLVVCPLLAGLYGAVNDQLTYTLAPEYFTKFKYQQFGLEPAWFGGARPTVAIIGFLATWWMGLLVGFVFSLLALLLPDARTMRRAVLRAVGQALALTAAAGVLGGLYGRLYLVDAGVEWWLPADLVDRAAFITVGSIHNFGYLGGLLGLVAGLLTILRRRSALATAPRRSTETLSA
ncbi:hypothetical protein [Hymenobacter jeollabukensis]|uniref:Uncharacterized protein n=1 Tax=Hymenobacter jeollabukensis TaxID=2025313 RepID=A0A5R8WP62_9BACT|nr:hypothetical protein [Hymenobacter jeollabukensis]TLM91756.1 hypothetical protein FDY95_14440 [Hymenobacter jeollabukensis]